MVETLCAILDQEQPCTGGRSYRERITSAKNRPSHDRHYAIDATHLKRGLSQKSTETFETGIRETMRQYLNNQDQVASVTSGAYCEWVGKQYA